MSRLQEHYRKNVAPALLTQFGYGNVMQVPRLLKITLNMGLGEAVANKKVIEHASAELTRISGQKAQVTYARKAVAGFKIREGWPVGCRVTLRGSRMYEFFDRLVSIAIPRIRDFRGLSNRSFDGRGNYSFGLKEQIVFPEIEYDKVDALRGLDVTITTSARNDKEAAALLKAFNFPLRN